MRTAPDETRDDIASAPETVIMKWTRPCAERLR
jgi:hypothetical protein